MSQEEDICSQIPPHLEELTDPMGGTQEQKEVDEDADTQPLPTEYKEQCEHFNEDLKEKSLESPTLVISYKDAEQFMKEKVEEEKEHEEKRKELLRSHTTQALTSSDGQNYTLHETCIVEEITKPKKYINENKMTKQGIKQLFEEKQADFPYNATYPYSILDLDHLKRPPMIDWEKLVPEQWDKYEIFRPDFHIEMIDTLEPHVYWLTENTEYSIDTRFTVPDNIKPLWVKGNKGYLSIRILKIPLVYLVIVFNTNEMAPHEVIILASQLLPKKVMKKRYQPLYRTKDSFQVFLCVDGETDEIEDFNPRQIMVSFNDTLLAKNLFLMKIFELEEIKGTLYENILMNIWTCFFIDVPQSTPEQKYISNIIMGTKHCFYDSFFKIYFDPGLAEMVDQNLYNFEYWIVRNSKIRLSYLRGLGLTWQKREKYKQSDLATVSLLEAAGVKGLMKRNQPTEKEWHEAIQETVDEMTEQEQPLKKIKLTPPPAKKDEPTVQYGKYKLKKFTV